MQRKIPNINFRNLLSSSSGVDKLKLHSIPISKMKNVKSNVLYSIPSVCALLLMVACSLVSGESCSATSTSLTIDGSTSKSITETISPNETKYVSSNVTYSADDVQDYTIKISYTNGSTGLKLDSTNSNVIIDGVVDNTTGSNIQNAWGYTWTSSNTTEAAYSGLSYNAIPSNGSSKNVETGTTINSTTKKLIFAANLSDTNPTGHYKADVLLSLIATPKAMVEYTLTYNANGGSGAPASQTCRAEEGATCSITISSTKPTRSSYTFLGWSTSSSATTASYQAGGSITISGNTTLYAVWQSQGVTWSNGTASGVTYMQDITTGTSTSSFCSSSLPTHASITLKDKRDNNSYTIVKMADGKCWMTQNLRIMGNRTLTSSDSDVTSNYTLPASSISGFSSETASNAYLSGSTGYYTWCATTAGTCTSATSAGQEAPSSICPKGWKLPSGNSNGEFSAFATAESIANSMIDSVKIQGSPYNFAYTGYVEDSKFYNPSENPDGSWWSRTAYDANGAYRLLIGNSHVYPGTYYNGRRYGYAVRCVAQ